MRLSATSRRSDPRHVQDDTWVEAALAPLIDAVEYQMNCWKKNITQQQPQSSKSEDDDKDIIEGSTKHYQHNIHQQQTSV